MLVCHEQKWNLNFMICFLDGMPSIVVRWAQGTSMEIDWCGRVDLLRQVHGTHPVRHQRLHNALLQVADAHQVLVGLELYGATAVPDHLVVSRLRESTVVLKNCCQLLPARRPASSAAPCFCSSRPGSHEPQELKLRERAPNRRAACACDMSRPASA